MFREPFGRIQRVGATPIPKEQRWKVLERKKEVINDLFAWEEGISFVTLPGPQYKRPVKAGELVLLEVPGNGILLSVDPDSIRRANDRLGLDPDDIDYARECFAEL